MSKNRFAILASVVGLTSSLLLASATATFAGPPKKAAASRKAAVAAQYECQKCHMRYSAALAKKNHFIDPMDGGKLTLVKTAPATPKKMSSSASKTKS